MANRFWSTEVDLSLWRFGWLGIMAVGSSWCEALSHEWHRVPFILCSFLFKYQYILYHTNRPLFHKEALGTIHDVGICWRGLQYIISEATSIKNWKIILFEKAFRSYSWHIRHTLRQHLGPGHHIPAPFTATRAFLVVKGRVIGKQPRYYSFSLKNYPPRAPKRQTPILDPGHSPLCLLPIHTWSWPWGHGLRDGGCFVWKPWEWEDWPHPQPATRHVRHTQHLVGLKDMLQATFFLQGFCSLPCGCLVIPLWQEKLTAPGWWSVICSRWFRVLSKRWLSVWALGSSLIRMKCASLLSCFCSSMKTPQALSMRNCGIVPIWMGGERFDPTTTPANWLSKKHGFKKLEQQFKYAIWFGGWWKDDDGQWVNAIWSFGAAGGYELNKSTVHTFLELKTLEVATGVWWVWFVKVAAFKRTMQVKINRKLTECFPFDGWSKSI